MAEGVEDVTACAVAGGAAGAPTLVPGTPEPAAAAPNRRRMVCTCDEVPAAGGVGAGAGSASIRWMVVFVSVGSMPLPRMISTTLASGSFRGFPNRTSCT